MSLDDARDTLRSVDAELDHARVLRAVHAESRPRRWTVPLAAAAAVACVALTTVGALAWAAAHDLPRPVRPATAPAPDVDPDVDPDVLADQVARAVARADVACVRVLQDGQVVAEQLHDGRTGQAAFLLSVVGSDWPGCGPTDGPTRAPTYDGPTPAAKVLIGGDTFGPLRDDAYDAVASETGLVLVGPRLRYEYELAPDSLRPVAVTVTGVDVATAEIAWFGADSEQARFLRDHGRPVS